MRRTQTAHAGGPGSKRLVWVSAGLIFVLGFEAAGLQLALLRVAGEFSLGPAMMGALASAQYFAMFVVQPVFGILSDRLGKKGIILGAVVLFAVGCLLAAGSQGAAAFMVGVFFAGAGYSLTESLSSAAIVDAFPQGAERYMNLSQSLFGAGAVAGPLVCSGLMEGFGLSWRVAFILPAAGFVLLLPFLAATPFVKAQRPAMEQQGGVPEKLRLMKPTYLLLLAAILLYGGMEEGTASFADSLLAVGLHAPRLGVYSLSLYWLAITVSRVLYGFMRLDTRRVLIAGNLASAVCLAVLALSASPGLSMAALGCLGLAMGPLWALLVSQAAQEFPGHSGVAVTLMSAASGGGAALLPLLVGAAAQAWGVPPAFWLVAACALAAAGICFAFRLLKSREGLSR